MADTFATTEKPFYQTLEGIAISAAVLFGTVWIISKAWNTAAK